MPEAYSKDEIVRRMKGAVSTVASEFGGLRSGRASPHLLDPVTVEVDARAQVHLRVAGQVDLRIAQEQEVQRAVGRAAFAD